MIVYGETSTSTVHHPWIQIFFHSLTLSNLLFLSAEFMKVLMQNMQDAINRGDEKESIRLARQLVGEKRRSSLQSNSSIQCSLSVQQQKDPLEEHESFSLVRSLCHYSHCFTSKCLIKIHYRHLSYRYVHIPFLLLSPYVFLFVVWRWQ